MSYAVQLMDAAKASAGLSSDYALAKALNCQPSRVCNYRNGRSTPDDEAAIRLAEMAKIPPLEAIAKINAERARTAEMRLWWEKIARGAAAACVMLAIAIAGAMPGNADATTVSSHAQKQTLSPSIYYAQFFMEPVTWRQRKCVSLNQSVSL